MEHPEQEVVTSLKPTETVAGPQTPPVPRAHAPSVSGTTVFDA